MWGCPPHAKVVFWLRNAGFALLVIKVVSLCENGVFMQESLSGLVEYNTCLPDSSSDSGESGACIPKVPFLSAGGEKSMGELEVVLGSSMLVTASCSPLCRGRCDVGYALWSKYFYALGRCLPRHLPNTAHYYKMTHGAFPGAN
jgi:hypothetical protein